MEYLFVYGTLMKGHHNNTFLSDSKFLGKCETVGKYQMLVDYIPYLNKRKFKPVKGELYMTHKTALGSIDELEGHPDFYKRERISVKYNNEIIDNVWCYFNYDDMGKRNLTNDFNNLDLVR